MAFPQDFSKVDQEKVVEHLRKTWGHNRTCPLCSKGPWQIQDKFFQLLEFTGGGLTVGGPVIPVVPITCANCGNTVLVNALRAGVIEHSKPEATK